MDQGTVVFRGDGEPRTPAEQATRLAALGRIDPDDYSLGGVVQKLEETFADLLGKTRAIFCPTGTLAQHLAVWKLCEGRPRALVQWNGHIYNDTGDGLTRLCGITTVPIGHDRPTFCADDVRRELERASKGRVVTAVGCVVVESPVRRAFGQCMPLDEMRAVVAVARDNGVGLHLDGARLYMMSAATGVPVRDYAALFDTVYVSLYKYFGAPFGAILAGPAELIDGLYTERRMFGGGLPSAALAAAAALEGLNGFEERFAQAMAKGRALFDALGVEPFEHGSNIYTLGRPVDPARLLERHVVVAPTADGILPLTVNTTILRQSNDDLIAAFHDAMTW